MTQDNVGHELLSHKNIKMQTNMKSYKGTLCWKCQ